MTPVEEILKHVSLPFKGELRDYQIEDINTLALVTTIGLYHDMGLGKTTTSALIASYKLLKEQYDTCYVLCPATLVTQWVGVLEKMGVVVAAYAGTIGERKKINRDVDFLVMSFEIFRNDYLILREANMFFIIDEATIMCSEKNILHKMINGGQKEKIIKVPGKLKPIKEVTTYPKLNKGAALLTGTPINKPENAYGLIKMTSPGAYRSYTHFLRVHVDKEDYFGQPECYTKLNLLKENLLRNSSMRSIHDHLELPPLIFKTVKYDLSKKHLELYNKLLDEKFVELDGKVVVDALQATALYNWSQKIILNPEQMGFEQDPFGLEVLDGLVDSVKQFLLFANYRITNSKLVERYDIGGIYGEVTRKLKDKYLADFKAGRLRGLSCHPKSGGVGLDLPMCQHIFFPELPITPRDLHQSIRRCWRSGQQETVVVTTLVARKTIQESLFYRIMDKDDLVAEIIDQSRSLREDLLSDVNKVDTKIKIKDLMGELRGAR